MSKKKVEKPKIEPLESGELFTIDFCSPVKDKVEICGPHVVVTPCSPLKTINCLPGIACFPLRCFPRSACFPILRGPGPCYPVIHCYPVMRCLPIVEESEKPFKIDELKAKIDGLKAEVEALKKKVGQT